MTSPSAPPEVSARRRGGAGLAVLVALVQLVGTAIWSAGQATAWDPLGCALLVVSGLALAARHRAPAATLVGIAVLTVGHQVLDHPRGPTFLALIIAAVVAARSDRRGPVALVAIASYAAWVVLGGPTLGRALTVAAWAAGLGILLAVVYAAAPMAIEMARRQRRLDEERRRRQASEERLRIAQELHDVLGHHLSLINVRASVGRHLMDRRPDEARAALDTIKQASAEALREVQSVLNTLYPSGEAAPRAPAPGLDRLDELTVDAGLPVRTTISGAPRPLPAEIDRAAYRIVQEALTNVRRHSCPGAAVTIAIDYREEELVMLIQDDGGMRGPITAATVEGNGVSGMRERATVLGGSLTAGPSPTGGWRVRAQLPAAGDPA
ncbi:signal transduction histidine kinase [Allocatelliglobosispora scoriae]|uniref:histidine kinase n=1 Tax=Allocatelliglobosispora scoriae TaxID=643052 RepID=A0A841C3A7_9ACTN|nr:histidine kinase [Allocatelliglobosispora scoriae]MBB5873532.1 signal transduction histidine kinase [Allocatelliglobosispora scoriae]